MVARRYSATHSPRGPAAGAGRPARSIAAGLMFVYPLPLLLSAFGGGALQMLRDLGALFLLLWAAWMLREGIAASAAYEARTLARRPALPRKIIAAAMTGAGVALALAVGPLPLGAILTGTVATALHLIAFGLDPMADKGRTAANAFELDRAARAVGEGEVHLKRIEAAIARTKDRKLAERMAAFAAEVRAMFAQVAEDPRDLTRARRYLGIYLLGARDAAETYASLQSRTEDAEARARFIALIDDLEAGFAKQRAELLVDDRDELDIEIDVLRARLERDGIRPAASRGKTETTDR